MPSQRDKVAQLPGTLRARSAPVELTQSEAFFLVFDHINSIREQIDQTDDAAEGARSNARANKIRVALREMRRHADRAAKLLDGMLDAAEEGTE